MSTSDFPRLLRDAGLRATPKRLAILEALAKERSPLTVEELARRVEGSMDVVTLYRALEAFRNAGLVHAVHVEPGVARFEIAHGRDHHHHAVCTRCGRVEDLDMAHADSMDAVALESAKGFASIERHSLEFFGVCNSCSSSS